MAVTKAQSQARPTDTVDAATRAAALDPQTASEVATTRTDDNVSRPSTVAPGDAPADTLDPTERVSTVPHTPGEEALRVGTVNAVLVNPSLPDAATVAANLRGGVRAGQEDRIETYEATRPNGEKVTVTHNLDTGETSAS